MNSHTMYGVIMTTTSRPSIPNSYVRACGSAKHARFSGKMRYILASPLCARSGSFYAQVFPDDKWKCPFCAFSQSLQHMSCCLSVASLIPASNSCQHNKAAHDAGEKRGHASTTIRASR
jgi:hypothetical protein